MNIVIVGGGFAGVKAALELSNKENITVQLISQGADFEYHGALYRSATGRSPLEVVLRLGDIFEKSNNIEVVIDKITAFNPATKYIKGESGRQYGYDSLLLCLGNEKNYFGIPGMDVFAHSMYTIHDTMHLRNELVNLFSLPHRKNVRVIVIGAGPSGTELSSELQNFANLVAEKYGHAPKKVEVDLIEGSDRVLPTLQPHASELALKRLQKVGVRVMLQKKVLQCSRNTVHLEGEELAADIIVWTAGSKAVGFYAKYPEVFELERGKVKVDEYLRVPKVSDVYVLGDNAYTIFSGMAQTAIGDGIFVAKNLIRSIHGSLPETYQPSKPIYVVPIGGKWAVSQINDKVRSGRYGWSIRRKADLFIFKNFEPIKVAFKTWRKGNRIAKF